MKKLPKILISILIISAFAPILNSAKTHALYIDDEGAPWWTVAELLEYKNFFETELKTTCGSNPDCVRDFYQSKRFNPDDEKMTALIRLIEHQFAVTSINPEQEKIKILFFDTDMMRLMMTGEEHKIEFQDFHFSWYEENFEKLNYYSGNYSNYKRQIRNNEIPEIHNIYSYISALDGKNPFPANQEVEIDATGTNLMNDAHKNIHFYVNSERNFNAVGGAQYKGCTLDPDYVPGMECRLMFSGIMGPKYMPPKENRASTEEPTPAPAPEKPTPEEPTKKEVAQTENPTSFETVKAPKSPNTGTFTSPCISKTIEFPWWLVGLIALGDAAVLWLFWPKPKNRQKSTKKLLTKGKKCDKMVTV